MAEIGNHAGKEPLLSLEWASWIFDRASWVLFASASLAAISTFLIVWMGIIKEDHWNDLRRKSNEKIATLENATAEAIARTKEAELALAKYKKPRILDIESFLETLKAAPPAKVEVLYVRECSDCSWTAQFIGSFLNTAGWEAVWAAIDEKKAADGPWRFQPVAVSVRGAPWGITVLAKDISESALKTPFGESVQKLRDALFKSYSEVVMTNDAELPSDLIRVVVAPKP